jgi:hypothetical protein
VEIVAALSVGVLFLSALTIAIKTFSLWRRTRQLPELLLSTMLFSVTVIGYPLAIVCTMVPATKLLAIHLAYPLAINGGFVCLLLFTLRVFRPEVRWAECLAGLTMVALAVSTVAYIVEVTGENPRPMPEMLGVALLDSVAIAVAYFWTTFESFGVYHRLRRQLRLGLTEPIVVDRVRLWGLMTLAAGIAVIMNVLAMLTGTLLSPPMVAVSSVLGLLHAGFLFLAFYPTGWYRDWVERRYALASA